MEQIENQEIINNSRVVNYLMNLLKTRKKSIANYSNTSRIIALLKEVRREIYYRPIKIGSAIVICVIAVNVVLSFLLKREISLFGWVIRGIFLFAGLAGLFCEVDLKNLISTSLFLKWINRYKQSDLEEK